MRRFPCLKWTRKRMQVRAVDHANNLSSFPYHLIFPIHLTFWHEPFATCQEIRCIRRSPFSMPTAVKQPWREQQALSWWGVFNQVSWFGVFAFWGSGCNGGLDFQLLQGTGNFIDQTISAANISSFVGHGLMNGALAPCISCRRTEL